MVKFNNKSTMIACNNGFPVVTITPDEFSAIRKLPTFDIAITTLRKMATERGVSYHPNYCLRVWVDVDKSLRLQNYIKTTDSSISKGDINDWL
jgi:hypothetical protein